jgi:hypothetical protein
VTLVIEYIGLIRGHLQVGLGFVDISV